MLWVEKNTVLYYSHGLFTTLTGSGPSAGYLETLFSCLQEGNEEKCKTQAQFNKCVFQT